MSVTETEAKHAVFNLLEYLHEDPTREGLKDTPARVVRALTEMTSGYLGDPKKILSAVFENKTDEMVILRGIAFTSLCEHHLLPFIGTATVGYLPKDRVVGISKLARVVTCFAKRLQIQENMTQQIANAVMEHLEPLGVGVVITAHHGCMSCRGVLQPNTQMVTSSLLGEFRRNPATRSEFLSVAMKE